MIKLAGHLNSPHELILLLEYHLLQGIFLLQNSQKLPNLIAKNFVYKIMHYLFVEFASKE